MGDHTRLKGVSAIGQTTLSDCIEQNLAAFLSWGLLGIGGFFNVRVGASGAYGDPSRLRPATDPYLTAGQAWQGARADWVWETGVECAQQPIRVSGVWVDGSFHSSSSTGAYAHFVDYPNGRVVFSSPVSSAKRIQCEHSPRWVRVCTSDQEWWGQVQADSFRYDDPQFALQGSGTWSLLASNRVQLPAVVVEALPRTRRVGLALGGGAVVSQDVYLTVLGETSSDVKKLHDIVTAQWQKRTVMYDPDWMSEASGYPLDENGTPRSGAMMYPDIVKPTGEGGFGRRQLRCEDFASAPRLFEPRSPIRACTVRGTYEVNTE